MKNKQNNTSIQLPNGDTPAQLPKPTTHAFQGPPPHPTRERLTVSNQSMPRPQQPPGRPVAAGPTPQLIRKQSQRWDPSRPTGIDSNQPSQGLWTHHTRNLPTRLGWRQPLLPLSPRGPGPTCHAKPKSSGYPPLSSVLCFLDP